MSREPFEPPAPMPDDPEMLAQYDFRGAVRGKHRGRFADGYVVRVEGADGTVELSRLVRLPPDVAAAFATDAAVHAALREWLGSRQDAA